MNAQDADLSVLVRRLREKYEEGPSAAGYVNLSVLIPLMREECKHSLPGRVIALASDKGGPGKTTVGVELSYLLGGGLLDGDWHRGNASRALGWKHEERVKSPMIDAVERQRLPRIIGGGPTRPHLIASGPDLEHRQPSEQVMEETVSWWAKELQMPLVCDTHPGGGECANGLCAAAHAVVSPVPLKQKDLDAFEGWAGAMDGYPLMIAPNMVPRIPPASQLNQLATVAKQYDLPVTTPLPFALPLERRRTRTAVCSLALRGNGQVGPDYRPFITAMVLVAWEVANYVGR